MVDFAFLDSGTGGLPYLSYLQECCPNARCVYVGDTKNFPYGPKPHEQIVECVLAVVKKIISQFEPSVIIIACNTISVNALDILREAYPGVLFVGTVPAIKLAASITKNKRIGLLATKATCSHPYNQDLMNHFAKDCELILREDTALIDYIEHKSFSATKEENLAAVKPAVDFFKNESCDVMILGCTHFLNLKNEFKEVCGPDLAVVDSCEGVVKRALQLGNCLETAETAGRTLTQTLGTDLNSDFGDTPRNLGDTPRNLGDTPRNLGDTPRNLGDGPRKLGDGPRNLRDTPRNLGDTPRNLGDTPRNLGDTPRTPAKLFYTGNENSEYKLVCERYGLINGGVLKL